MSPDQDNRCFARFRKVSVLWLFAAKRLGGWVDLAYQGTACYGDYRQCQHYQKKASRREVPEGEVDGK